MRQLTLITCLLTLIVIVLGAYTRLTDAGLGCPDWPGCYGHWTVPQDNTAILHAEQRYQQPIEAKKAWTEMVHRYVAGSLGLCILTLSILAFRKKTLSRSLRFMPIVIVALVVLQALLGMWTVTLKLLPIIILLHLLGGLTILSLLWWYFLALKKKEVAPIQLTSSTWWAILGIILLVVQIILGGLTSANYAALVCPDFPYCQGQLLPSLDLSVLFNINQITQDNTTLVTLHMLHRIGALFVGLYLFCLALALIIFNKQSSLRLNGIVIAILLVVQISLGILNVIWLLPLSTAVSHNLVAALLLLSLVTALFLSFKRNASILSRGQ